MTDGVTIAGAQVTGIRDPFSMQTGDMVSMSNPFSGYRDAIHVGTQKIRVPADLPVPAQEWVTNNWNYISNTLDVPTAGSCGSVILDEDGKAVSFFRYVLESQPGFSIGVAASTLEKLGYNVI